VRTMMMACAAVVLAATLSLQAQRGSGSRVIDIDSQVARYNTRLELSDTQSVQLRTILEEQQKEMNSVFENTSDDRETKRSKMMDIRARTDTRIVKILTEVQVLEFEKMSKEQEQSHKQMRRNRR